MVFNFNGKVPVKDGELYFESFGKGAPLVLIHAGFSDRRNWKYQLDELATKFQVVIYDQRGSGNSSPVASAFSPADDLKSLLDHLKIKKARLLGHSLGGTIALDFTLQYPESVTSLVLLAPGVNGYKWSSAYMEWAQAIWGSIPQIEKMTKQALSAPFYEIAMSDPKLKLEIETITTESFENILKWKTFNVSDVIWYFPEPIARLKDLFLPVFIIYGEHDSADIKTIAQTLDKNLVNSKLLCLQNADHLLNFEKAAEINRLILENDF